jgi:hypothetical protein
MHWFWRATIAVIGGLVFFPVAQKVGLDLTSRRPHGPTLFLVVECVCLMGSLLIAVSSYGLLTRKYYRTWRPDSHPHCPQCEYDLTGNVSGVCPECGERIRVEGTAERG